MAVLKSWYPTFLFVTGLLCFSVYQMKIYGKRIPTESAQHDRPNVIQHVNSSSTVKETNGTNSVSNSVTKMEIPSPSTDCFTKESNFTGVSQEDPGLIDCIRRHLIHPPSLHPYNLKNPDKVHFSQYNQSRYADSVLFHGMRDGFFLEVGALDGEHLTNTLYFERELGWRGLLIEPLPHVYQELLKKNRKAFSINAALATSTEPSEVSFIVDGVDGALSRISRPPSEKITKLLSLPKYSSLNQGQLVQDKKRIKVKALPLYSILRALNVTVVDFFSLDIESFEVKVLKTLPWDKVKFRLMCIEINHIPEGLPHLVRYLTRKGYKYLGVRVLDAWFRWPEPVKLSTK